MCYIAIANGPFIVHLLTKDGDFPWNYQRVIKHQHEATIRAIIEPVTNNQLLIGCDGGYSPRRFIADDISKFLSTTSMLWDWKDVPSGKEILKLRKWNYYMVGFEASHGWIPGWDDVPLKTEDFQTSWWNCQNSHGNPGLPPYSGKPNMNQGASERPLLLGGFKSQVNYWQHDWWTNHIQ